MRSFTESAHGDDMEVQQAIKARRTIRKFQPRQIDQRILERLVDMGRLAPSGANQQPLKYCIVNQPDLVSKVLQEVKWAALIAPQGTPKEEEAPTAFLGVLGDTSIKASGFELEAGAAIENILLAAVEEGLGSCWMGAIHRKNIAEILGLPERFTLISVIALGYPAEQPITEEIMGSTAYYLAENGQLHVPKRTLCEVLFPVHSSQTD